MKTRKVIESFKGSPDGRTCVNYTKGQVVELTDSLAKTADAEGWVEEATEGDKEVDLPSEVDPALLKESVTAIVKQFPMLTVGTMQKLCKAEEGGKKRSSLITAFKEELASRDES